MRQRIGILKEHGLRLTDIQQVIRSIGPLEGALDFMEALRSMTQVIILSDTFQEFAQPLMEALRWPTLFCNRLIVDQDAMITGYELRQYDGKRKAVAALQSIGFKVFAAGDSYNDLTMIRQADAGAFFRAPESILKENPDLPAAHDYRELMSAVQQARGI